MNPVNPRPLILETDSGLPSITIAPGTMVLVGRDPRCDVPVPHLLMGRRQAVFRHAGDTCTVEDADSPGGTYVNEHHVRGATALTEGDEIRLGGVRYRVRWG